VYKRDYAFCMNVMEEIFEIRSCIEILANDTWSLMSTQLYCEYSQYSMYLSTWHTVTHEKT